MNKKSLVSEFLSLKCSGDVLNIAHPINKSEKEISEAMSLVQIIKRHVLNTPMEYTLIDMCAGNALTGLISAFLLPVKEVIAVDIRPRKRKWELAKRFKYVTSDIDDYKIPDGKIILTASHACKGLAKKIINMYNNNNNIEALVLMPCCVGQIDQKIPQLIKNNLGRYLTWAFDLALMANGTFKKEDRCLSPCNAIVTAEKTK